MPSETTRTRTTLFNFGADDEAQPRRMILLSLPLIAGGIGMRIAAGWWFPRIGMDPSFVEIMELMPMGLVFIASLVLCFNLASIMAIRVREFGEALSGDAYQADG